MYPEAGGSSSFARRAFNEFWSFFAAWGQMLTYIITIAISAFFVPHYLGVFWEPLGESPGRHRGRHRRGGRCWRSSTSSASRSRPASTSSSRSRTSCTQVLLVMVGVVLVLDPEQLVDQVDFGTLPDGRRLPDRDPGRRWSPTPASRRSRTWPRRRATTARRSRAASALVVVAVAVIYVFLPAVALSAMPVVNGETLLAKPKEEGGYADDPILGVVENMDLGALQGAAEIYVGHPRRHDPVHRHERRASSASRGSPTRWASTASCPRALRALHPRFRTPYVAITVFGAIACLDDPPGPGRLPGRDLRLRRDAVVHDRARRRDRRCASSNPDRERPWRVPVNLTVRGPRACRCSRSSAASAPASALLVATVLDLAC